jgi:hypothetical protein
MSYDEFEAERIKHLEMIQAVVSRLGTDSFLVKGWAVTLSAALFGFAINGKDWQLAALATVPTVLLWGLDAYFLRAERLFRELYDAVRNGTSGIEPFFLGATGSDFAARVGERKRLAWHQVLWSPTLLVFYLALLVVAIGLAILLHCR